MTAPIKLCVIGDGSSVHIQKRTALFANRGYDVTLISTAPIYLPNVRTIVVKPLAIPFLSPFVNILQHIYILRQIDADIFHIHFARRPGSWAVPIANIHPYIVSTMGGDVLYEERGISAYQQHLTERVLEQADFITVKSNYILNDLAKRFPIDKMMRVIWGISLEKFYPVDSVSLREKLGLDKNSIVILSPKILRAFYNIHVIIDAMPLVLQQHPRAKLLITEYQADLSYKRQLQQQIERLGVGSSVQFVGSIPNDGFSTYYSLSNVVIAVPSSDGFPQTVLEAMACDTPNILANLPNYSEFLTHKKNAYFVEIEPESVAKGINHLLDDETLYNQIVASGTNLVQQIGNIQREATRVEALYQQVIENNKQPATGHIHYGAFGEIMRFGLGRLLEKVLAR